MKVESQALANLPGIRHAFFTREGGVSEGIYASLNGGVGSNDDPAKVQENRRRMTEALGAEHLITCYQIHSADVVVAGKVWSRENAARADAIVTRTPGLAVASPPPIAGRCCSRIQEPALSPPRMRAGRARWTELPKQRSQRWKSSARSAKLSWWRSGR